MGRKSETFYSELLTHELVDAVNNDFGKAILRLPNQGRGEVREEVMVYFSAVAMQQVNAIAQKHGINDQEALHELYQLSRANLVQGLPHRARHEKALVSELIDNFRNVDLHDIETFYKVDNFCYVDNFLDVNNFCAASRAFQSWAMA